MNNCHRIAYVWDHYLDKLNERDPRAIANVVEGLIMSGVAMGFADVSRPASGVEHYFSHMWEMRALLTGQHADLHGIQVGIGTLLTLKIYEWMRQLIPDRERAERAMRGFDQEKWASEIRRIFGSTADQIFKIEEKTRKNDPAKHARRLGRIIENWDGIQRIIREELPSHDSIRALMARLNMPMKPADIGIPPAGVRDAFVGARDIRDKYLSCSMLWDLGLLEEFGDRLMACEEAEG